MPILLAILAKVWKPLALVVVVSAVLFWVNHRLQSWCNDRCEAAELRADKAEGLLKEAQDRATYLANLWAESINKVRIEYVERVQQRDDGFRGVRTSAGRIRPVTSAVHVPVPRDAVVVLRDSTRLANSTTPAAGNIEPSAPVPEPAGDRVTTLDQWVAFAIDAAEAYRDARDKHAACVEAYGKIVVRE